MGAIRFFTAALISIASAIAELLLIWADRKRGRVFHAIARTWARMVLTVCSVNVTVRGLEKVDLSRNYVYVSNHASMFDIPVILAGIPDQIRIIYKKELDIIPFFGWGLRYGSYIGIDRGRGSRAVRSLEEAVEKIRHGASVLMYAEGTRTLDGKLQPFKRGAFNLALKAGIPVVPLTVNGSFSILPKHSVSVRPGNVELVLESPIPVPEGEGKDAEVRLMQDVHAAIARHYIDQG
ncbi:MAG TPA: lysophospholipid acyltransferase family protein [Bacteroidota bacterium]|nr:lysophospholipid acyltransferase family protein [Bacteroidota bacterium]